MGTHREEVNGVRAAHRRAVLSSVLDHGPSTARDVTEATGLSVVTTTALLRELQDRGLVEPATPRPALRGPWSRTYAVPPDAVRGVAAVHRPGELVVAATGPVDRERATVVPVPGDLPDAAEVAHALTAAGSASYAVVGVTPWIRPGAAARRQALADALRDRLGHVVEVRRHSELTAVAEARSGAPDFLMVTAGPVVTVTHVVDGVPRVGAHGLAGALGLPATAGAPAVARAIAVACLTIDPGLVVLDPALIRVTGPDLRRLVAAAIGELRPEPPEVVPGAVAGDTALCGAVHLARAGARAAYLAISRRR